MVEQLLQNRIQELEQALSLAQEELLGCREKLVQTEQIMDSLFEEKRVLLNSNNITAQKITEESLREEKILLQTIIDIIPINIYVKDTQSRKIVANRAEYEYMGFTKSEDILNKSDDELYSDLSAKVSIAEDQEVLRGKPIINRETYCTQKDGTQTCFLISKIPLYHTDNQLVGLVGVSIDITERKNQEIQIKQQNEELFTIQEELEANLEELTQIKDDLENQQVALQASEERYRQVVETQTDFVLLSEPDTTITFANEPLARILGVTTQAMLGQKWINFAMPEDLESILQKISELKPNNPNFKTENRDRRSNGEWGWTQWINQGIFGVTGQLIQIQSIGRDITELKTIENQIVIEQRRLNDILRGTNVGTWEWNIQTNETIFNERWANIIGYTLSELQPVNIDTWTKFAHPEDLQVSSELLNQHFAGELEYYMCDVRMRHKEGHWVWVITKSKAHTWTDDGKPLWMSGTHQDITERKTLEEQREFERINQEALINSTKDLIWSINKDYQLITANQTFIESIEEFSGVTLKPGSFVLSSEIFSDELIHFWKNIYDDVLAGKTFNQEFPRPMKANQEAWLDLTINPIWNGQEITGLACFGRDITQRKLAENALRLSEQRLKTIIETEPECVKVVNAKGDLLEMNKAGLAMLEVNSLEEVQFHSLLEFILPPYRLAFKALHQKVMQGENGLLEFEIVGLRGTKRWLETHATPLRNKQNEITMLLGVTRDITERKQAELALQEKEYFLRSVANHVPGMLGYWTNNLICKFANKEYLDYFGYTPLQMQGISIQELLGDELFKKNEPYIQAVLSGENQKFERKLINQRGETRFTLTHYIADIVDEKIEGFFALVTDITEIKKAQLMAQENEQKFRVLFEQVAIGVAQINSQTGRFIEINQKYAEIIGYSQEELQSLDFQTITYPADLAMDLEQMELLKQGKIGQFKLEKRYFHKQGHIIWVELSVSPMWEVGEKPDFHIAVVSDISERKRLESTVIQSFNQLQKHKQKLESITQALDNSAIVSITDLEGRIIKTNQKFCELSQYSEEELLGQDHHIVNSGYHPKEFWRQMWQTIAKGKPWRGEVKNRAKDGSEYWVDTINNPILDVSGKIVQYLSIRFDITERKKMEEQLYRLSMVAQRTSNVVIITDTKRQIIWANEALTHITGYTLAEVLGKHPSLFQCEDTDEQTIRFLREKLNKIEPVQCEILNKGKTEDTYWLDIEIQPLWDKNNRHTGFMAIQTNITERKKTQKELNHLIEITQNQNQRLREYAHITSHNMRSSVANLLSLSELLKEEPSNEMFLDMMSTSVQQLDNTIRTMNDLLEVENESQILAKSRINLLQAVQNNCLLIQNLIKDKVKIILDIPTDLSINVIPAYLDSILNNLLTNAIKYRRPEIESIVEISAWKEKNGITLSVKDNGIGIDLERNGNKLFKMKSRFHLQVEGKGMGLFFTRHQIEAMGGKITVESKPAQGSIFRVWFYES